MREQQENQKAADTVIPIERRKDREENKKRPTYDMLADEYPHICRGID